MKSIIFVLFLVLASGQLIAQTNQQEKGQAEQCASLRRGEHLPKLADFAVPKSATIHPKPPILSTAKDRHYRTAIRTSTVKGENFAGHYTIAQWGCGTGCLEFVIVDVSTGKVYDPFFQTVDYHYPSEDLDTESEWWCYTENLNYSLDSRLLIIEGCLSGKSCGRNYFVMEPSGLRHIHYDPDLLKDGTKAPF